MNLNVVDSVTNAVGHYALNIFSLDFFSSISRPQKRDQTEQYNENHFGLFPKFWFSKVDGVTREYFRPEINFRFFQGFRFLNLRNLISGYVTARWSFAELSDLGEIVGGFPMAYTLGTRQGCFPVAQGCFPVSAWVSDIPRDACGWPRATPDAAMTGCQDINRIRWFSVF